jgi:hypothetical protein
MPTVGGGGLSAIPISFSVAWAASAGAVRDRALGFCEQRDGVVAVVAVDAREDQLRAIRAAEQRRKAQRVVGAVTPVAADDDLPECHRGDATHGPRVEYPHAARSRIWVNY